MGITDTNRYNRNIAGFISSYNIPLLKIMQKKKPMRICSKSDPVKQLGFVQRGPRRKFMCAIDE